jgi:hypothetical protein
VMVAVRTSKSFKHASMVPRADVAQRRRKEKSWVCWGGSGWMDFDADILDGVLIGDFGSKHITASIEPFPNPFTSAVATSAV